ncbi:MAG: DNA polymerase I [Lachnospiraceae bacterium]|nr:DNA polymerase I [Lachnospiraceae bacterium]
MEKKLVLIDGNSIINRAFYGVPELTNRDGLHTNAIYGFLNIMFKVMEEEEPSHMLVAFDEKAPTFRHTMYEQYKGTRKPMPEELREQVPVLKEVLQAMNIMIFSREGIEADDILGTMAKKGEKEGYEVSVVSGDRDLLQLASDTVLVRIPKTRGGQTVVENYHTAQVIEKHGVTPAQIIDLKGLMGDSSDNIPGVPGVGEKTALKILTMFGTVENAIAHVEEITPNRAKEAVKKHASLAKLSKTLATIKTDCRLGISMEQCRLEDMYNEKAFRLIQSLDIKSLLKRFGDNPTGDEGLEKNFVNITTSVEWKKFWEGLDKTQAIGVKAVYREKEDVSVDGAGQMTLFLSGTEGRLLGMAVSFSKEKTAFARVGEKLSEQDITSRLGSLSKEGHVLAANDLKSQLDFFPEAAPENAVDTNVAAYLINPIQKSFAEEDIADEYAGISLYPYSQVFGKQPLEAALAEKPEELARYACYCALVNALACPALEKELKKQKMAELFRTMEMPLVFALYDMEKWGILVKGQALTEYGSRLGERIAELEEQIYDRAGEPFNINSPKQLGVILFEKMRMPYGKKTKTGYSTSAEVLEKLRFEDPIIEMILEYRQLAKLKSTYADGLETYIDEKDGRIHTTFNQNITATGRLSSTEPNLQNIPIRMELGRQIRKVFVPEKEYVFLDADYSQIELRVLAHMSGDERLIEAYKENADIHRTTASLVFHTPYEEVTDLQRRNAKAVNFGIVYGISGFGLSRDLNITRKEAERYIENYFHTYPRVKAFMEELVETGKSKGYVTTMFGRRRPIPELKSKNFMQRQFGERIAMNSPIQGTAADIIKIAMLRVADRLKQGHFRSRLILQIHDELLIETHREEIPEVTRLLEEEMVQACELAVPLIAEVKQGDNWYEAK